MLNGKVILSVNTNTFHASIQQCMNYMYTYYYALFLQNSCGGGTPSVCVGC